MAPPLKLSNKFLSSFLPFFFLNSVDSFNRWRCGRVGMEAGDKCGVASYQIFLVPTPSSPDSSSPGWLTTSIPAYYSNSSHSSSPVTRGSDRCAESIRRSGLPPPPPPSAVFLDNSRIYDRIHLKFGSVEVQYPKILASFFQIFKSIFKASIRRLKWREWAVNPDPTGAGFLPASITR